MAINTIKPTKVRVSKKPASKPSYAERKAFAEQMSGYNDQSPIWNKPLAEVLDLIEKEILSGSGHPLELIQELRKRIARGQIMKAQS